MTSKEMMDKLAKLSSAERIMLAQGLWDSVCDDPEAWELSQQQQREFDRRLKAHASRKSGGQPTGASWAQVKKRMRRKA